jgi:WD40 repeat protein
LAIESSAISVWDPFTASQQYALPHLGSPSSGKVDAETLVEFDNEQQLWAIARKRDSSGQRCLVRFSSDALSHTTLIENLPSRMPANIWFNPSSAVLSRNHRLFAVAEMSPTDQAIQLWDVKTGKLLKRYDAHLGEVGDLAFSPDGSTLATISEVGGPIYLWPLKLDGRSRDD